MRALPTPKPQQSIPPASRPKAAAPNVLGEHRQPHTTSTPAPPSITSHAVAGSDHVWQAIAASARPAAPGATGPTNKGTGRRVAVQRAVVQRVRRTKTKHEDEEYRPPGTRRQYLMGSTPNKTSPTGRALLRRWEGKGKAKYRGSKTGVMKFKDTAKWKVFIQKARDSRRSWVNLDAKYRSKNGNMKTAIHMGHKLAAAEYYSRGARRFVRMKPHKYRTRYASYMRPGKDVDESVRRQFMKDDKNYKFQYYSLNSSDGSGGYTYQ